MDNHQQFFVPTPISIPNTMLELILGCFMQWLIPLLKLKSLFHQRFLSFLFLILSPSLLLLNTFPQAHPIPDPSNPLSCGDVPSEVMGSTMSEQPAFCIEEGQTHIFDVDSGFSFLLFFCFVFSLFSFFPVIQLFSPCRYQQAGIVLPVDSGCKTVTIATAIEIPTSATQSTFLFCYPPRTTAPRKIYSFFFLITIFSSFFLSSATTDNVGLFQTGINGQTLSITACFDEPAYLRCTLRLITTQPVHFSFSTSAPVCALSLFSSP